MPSYELTIRAFLHSHQTKFELEDLSLTKLIINAPLATPSDQSLTWPFYSYYAQETLWFIVINFIQTKLPGLGLLFSPVSHLSHALSTPMDKEALSFTPPPFYSPHWKGCALPISSTYNTYNYSYRSDLDPPTLSVTSSYDITTSSTFGTPFLTFRYLKEIFYYSAQPNSPYLAHTNLIAPWNYFLPFALYFTFSQSWFNSRTVPFTFSLFSILPYAGLQKY